MHELGLLTGVVAAAENAAHGRRVELVRLKVGRRSGVLIDALYSAWPIARDGSLCEQAELSIEDIPAAVWCPHCEAEQEIDEYFALTCPVCDTPTADLRHGKEFAVDYIELADPPQP